MSTENTDKSLSKVIGELTKELIDRAPLFTLVIGALLLIIAALGRFPNENSTRTMEPFWQYVVAAAGGILLIAGLILIVNGSKSPDPKRTGPTTARSTSDPTLMERLTRSGLVQAYKIPVNNAIRDERVRQLIAQESITNRKLRLLANSGFSYLHPIGKVWAEAGLGKLIVSGEIEMIVVLESPFSHFAITRAIANNVTEHHWEDKQKPANLIHLLQYPKVTIRVTEEAVNCSLFITSQAIFYDPYLWALPAPGNRTENKFLVFEFDRVHDPEYYCYNLLEKHFDFLFYKSVPLEEVLHTPKAGASMPRGKAFFDLYESNPTLALNKYNLQTKNFRDTVRKAQLNKGRYP